MKQQRKLNAIAFNGVVISITEVADDKAETIIDDIDDQIKKLRRIAEKLAIPNHNMLNWLLHHQIVPPHRKS